MAQNIVKTRFQQRYDTEANWSSIDPVLLAGEIAISSDKSNKYKVGDGTSTWSALTYAKAEMTKADVGLSNVDNTADSTKTVAKAGALTVSAGTATQPVYFSSGKPVSCTYTLGKSVPSNAVFTDTIYTHPTASGNKHIPSGGASGQILRWSADGTASWGADNNTTYSNFKGATTTAAGSSGLVIAPSAGSANRYLRSDGTWSVPPDNNTTYSVFKAATSSVAGGTGLVPAPGAGAQAKYLRADGTWQTPPDTNTTYGVATTSANGLMSSTDKSRSDEMYTALSTAITQTEINALF